MNCKKHDTSQTPSFEFTNVKPNEIFSNAVVLIRGIISNFNHRYGITKGIVSNGGHIMTRTLSITNDGHFKTILKLIPGKNSFVFQYCCISSEISLYCNRCQNSKFRLKIYYVICQNHDGRFQSVQGISNTVQSACEKINQIIALVQCFYAETLIQNGFDRKTFDFIECEPFYSRLAVEEARCWSPYQLWQYHAKEFLCKETDDTNSYKYFGILASTLFINGILKANAALGIGDVALYGSGTMYSWPSHFDDIQECFLNETSIDTNILFDDSNGRKTFGGCFTTALGAIAHEMGHIFDLGHTMEGIMGNDIDFVNRMFIIEQFPIYLPPRIKFNCNLNQNENKSKNIDRRLTYVKKTNPILLKYHNRRAIEINLLSKNCAILLNSHKWFNSDVESIDWDIQYEIEHKTIVSKLPLILVEFRTKNDGLILDYVRFEQKQMSFKLPLDKIEQNYDLLAVDSNGNIKKFSILS